MEDLRPYWRFIKEATKALRARNFRLDGTKLGRLCRPGRSACVLSVWPRMIFFVDDGVYLDNHGSSIGPVMHHGIKDQKWMVNYFKDLDTCLVSSSALVSPDRLGRKALGLARGYSHLYEQGACNQCTQECLMNFACRPDADG